MTQNWPEQIRKWKIQNGLIRDPNFTPLPKEICPKCFSNSLEIRRYGLTGQLGDVYCNTCGLRVRPWNAY